MLSDKILFSMDLSVLMAVEQLANEANETTEDTLLSFMKSNTAKMVYDDSTKLWWDGPAEIAEEYKIESGKMTNKNRDLMR